MSASDAVSYAIHRLGHFAENTGANTGDELDQLEASYNLHGEPWCAMFATTAVAQGGDTSGRTASVAQINAWAREGSHGYQKGLLPTSAAQPGDLITFGDRHVGVVTRKDPNGTIHTIEGNTGENKVSIESHPAGSGQIVRPAYPSSGGGGGGGLGNALKDVAEAAALPVVGPGAAVYEGGKAIVGAGGDAAGAVTGAISDAFGSVWKALTDSALKAGLYLTLIASATVLIVLGVLRTTGQHAPTGATT